MSEPTEKKKKSSIASPSQTWSDNFMTRPLTTAPSKVANAVANKMDAPTMGSTSFNPNSTLGKVENAANVGGAMVRGGLAGATQGVGNVLTDMTSPLSLAAMLLSGGASKALPSPKGISSITRPTMDIIHSNPVKQVAPAIDDVDALIGSLKSNLAKIPSKKPSIIPPTAEMVAPGGEEAFNATRPMSNIFKNMNPPQMMKPKLPSLMSKLPKQRS